MKNSGKREIHQMRKGFTLAELMITTTILAILIVSAADVYTNFYNSVNNLKAADTIYEEARFTLERIAKEVRNGTIDYEEYYNQTANYAGTDETINDSYTKNYCQYSRQFYGSGPDKQFGTLDDESLGIRKSPSVAPMSSIIQNKLFLINAKGDKRTYIKKLEMPIASGKKIGKIGILKLTGKDYGMDHIDADANNSGNCKRDSGENDGLIDTWECDPGYRCDNATSTIITLTPPSTCSGPIYTVMDDPDNLDSSSFMDITPATLDVVDLKFYITPKDDPYKAYNDPSVQIQPYVTIKMTVRASSNIVHDYKGGVPDIVLETTVSARAYNEIITACNLQECLDGTKRDCPKKPCADSGACTVAQVTCSQGVWPVCTDDIYVTQAGINAANTGSASLSGLIIINSNPPQGLDSNVPFNNINTSMWGVNYNGSYTYFENTSEVGSCTQIFPSTDTANITLCREERCSDRFDNDGNGLADKDDPACVEQLCNNGVYDPPIETCIDVGDKCYMRPKDVGDEANCFDGYDNNCNYNPTDGTGGADQFDQSCVNALCSDGIQDPPIGTNYLRPDYSPRNYLLGAKSTDVSTDMDEKCIDIGGMCQNAVGGMAPYGTIITKALEPISEIGSCDSITNEDDKNYCKKIKCSDGLDNDCNGLADEFDSACKTYFCSNKQINNGLAPWSYSDHSYLGDYTPITDPSLGLITTDMDEICADVGGLCGPLDHENPSVTENTVALCNNKIDDNCDTHTDQYDSGCCPDNDGDGFIPIIGTSPTDFLLCKEPACSINGFMCNKAKDSVEISGGAISTDPPVGEMDCNDNDSSIKPQKKETTCNDAKYPITYPIVKLQGKYIDENCSFENKVTTAPQDSRDPTCCVDKDKDGYGACDGDGDGKNNNRAIFWDGFSVECSQSGDIDHKPTTFGKCDPDDSNPAINPGMPELCDGIDNNGNGQTDEGFNLGSACSVGVGACKATGIKICTADKTASECDAVPGTPSAEICDGIDNNCDNSIDEGFNVGAQCTVGIGICENTGEYQCKADGSGTECSVEPKC